MLWQPNYRIVTSSYRNGPDIEVSVTCYVGDKQVGYCGFEIDPKGIVRLGFSEGHMMLVAPSYRNQGIAGRLFDVRMDLVHKCAKSHSIALEKALAAPTHSFAEKILRRRGFVKDDASDLVQFYKLLR